MPRLNQPIGRRPTLILILAVAALAFPLGVLASHQFSDVPTSASYHDDVESLVEAGITAGCGGGNFCPTNAVTRAQMAQFLTRGLSRVAMSSEMIAGTGTITQDEGFVTVSQVTIEVPGVSGDQLVHVHAEIQAGATLLECTNFCAVQARIRSTDGFLSLLAVYTFPEGVQHFDMLAKDWVFTHEPGEHTYQLQVALFNTESTLNVTEPTLVATTYPCGIVDNPTAETANCTSD